MLLSCVIIAKNEERNIARCIESVLSCTQNIVSKEILLVDSCSIDKTVEIAKKYPINIIQLKPSWRLSPAAGRFSGINNISGEYVLVIDGDMELLKGWIEAALDFLSNNLLVAAVLGRQYDVFYDNNWQTSKPRLGRNSKRGDKVREVDYLHQSSVFRRTFLLEAGNFYPFLRAEEEAEISCRLRNRGYGLFFLPCDSINHYSKPRDSFLETKRRIKNRFYVGMGDMMKLALQNKYYSIIWKRFKVFIFFIFLLLTSLIGTIYFLSMSEIFYSLSFLSIPFCFIVFMCIKKKGCYQGILSSLNIGIISLELIKGIFRKTSLISDYPIDVLWIKKVRESNE